MQVDADIFININDSFEGETSVYITDLQFFH